jgi:hypothetical protein
VGDADDEDAHADTPVRRSSCSTRRDRLAVLVEGQDLQLVRQVDLADVDARRHLQQRGREVQDARDAGVDQPVADRPARRRRASR